MSAKKTGQIWIRKPNKGMKIRQRTVEWRTYKERNSKVKDQMKKLADKEWPGVDVEIDVTTLDLNGGKVTALSDHRLLCQFGVSRVEAKDEEIPEPVDALFVLDGAK